MQLIGHLTLTLSLWSICGQATAREEDHNADWLQPHRNSDVHFLNRGKIMGSVNYAHVVIDIDLNQIQNSVERLCNITQEWLRFENQTQLPSVSMFSSASRHIDGVPKKRYLDTLREVARERCERVRDQWTNMLDIWLETDDIGASHFNRQTRTDVGHQNRDKRQAGLIVVGIIALASFLFTHVQLSALSVSTGTTNHAMAVMQDHETRVDINERSINLMKEEIADSRETERILTSLNVVYHALFVQSEIEHELMRVMSGLQMLSLRKLSPDLVHTDDLREVLRRLGKSAQNHYMELAIDRPEELFGCETSHIIFANQSMRVFVHVPAYRHDGIMDLYQYVKMPLQVMGSEHFILPEPEGDLIAIGKGAGWYKTMTINELTACKRVRDIFYCNNNNIFDKRTSDSCLVGLYHSDAAAVKRNCQFSVEPDRDQLVQLNATAFVLYQYSIGYVELICSMGGSHRRIANFKGVKLVHVASTCRGNSRSFVFDGTQGIFSEAVGWHLRSVRMNEVIGDELLQKMANVSQETLARMALVGTSKGLSVKDLSVGFENERVEQLTKVLVITSLIGLCIGLVVLYLCKTHRLCFGDRRIAFFASRNEASAEAQSRRLEVDDESQMNMIEFARNDRINQSSRSFRRQVHNPSPVNEAEADEDPLPVKYAMPGDMSAHLTPVDTRPTTNWAA